VDNEDHSDFITVTSGMSGYFAVHMTWDEEGEFWEPWTTGVGRYRTKDAADNEACNWALEDNIRLSI